MAGGGRMNFNISTVIFSAVEIEGIIAATITSIAALIGVIWQSRKTRRVNTDEHNANAIKLDKIETKLDRVDFRIDRVHDKLEDHLDDHHKQDLLDKRKIL